MFFFLKLYLFTYSFLNERYILNARYVTPKIWNTFLQRKIRSVSKKVASMISPVGTLLILSNRYAYVDAPSRSLTNPPLANNQRNNNTHTFFRENFRNGYCDVFRATEPRSIPSESLLTNGTAAILKTAG